MEKAVVFGGAGFLGSHVADELTRAGYDVVIFDKRYSQYLQQGQTMLVGDILDAGQIRDAVKGAQYVYNFAGLADIEECKARPIDTIKLNILGNSMILDAARSERIERFVFASTMYVYSDAGAFYRVSKQACELIIEDYSRLHALPYTILRYGSLYGERSDSRNSVYRIIREALTEEKITYYGTGEEEREFLHVKDAARTSVEVLGGAFRNECVIVTGQKVMKYREFLEMISEMLKGKVTIEYRQKKLDTHYRITPYTFDPKFAKKMSPEQHVDLGQGLIHCMNQIYNELNEERKSSLRIALGGNDFC
ncbi:MAG TPA: NAD-dependent epimerase [Deltaproteobacteria bacterium]|nr:MAG: NAD-dependent epimerase [Deltaproteobacteria bacterium GWA2_55_82]OGQ63478.1 MAG: NAD-dependent epimerase [Deltaproteobacteria bacterium RIFCSPLOWO2_02_FULL_55_12]OIJ74859.1 MAG: NAD-dependent epimerase [Deltaproteobacteria bacterium GWC2_55_46]HBG47492.1 NAD-dependent epimerase [Deltaproteobacteria bacterium]HCY11508.1 NAD-dependent epimerase [Deltaproteobacteria bacterium]